MYDWKADWPNVFAIRKFKHANLYPYAGRDPYLQFMEAMWVLAVELNYGL